MDITMVILRVIHILSGVAWAGGSFMMAAFVGPTAQALAEDGAKFMRHIATQSRFSEFMATVAVLTSLSGLTMYYRLYGFLAPLNVGTGLAITIGAIAGLIALYIGFNYQARSTWRIRAIAKEIAAAGGPPQPEQLAELQSLGALMATSGVWLTIVIAIALIGMSLSEYFAF